MPLNRKNNVIHIYKIELSKYSKKKINLENTLDKVDQLKPETHLSTNRKYHILCPFPSHLLNCKKNPTMYVSCGWMWDRVCLLDTSEAGPNNAYQPYHPVRIFNIHNGVCACLCGQFGSYDTVHAVAFLTEV